MEAYALDAATTAFDESRERFETILAWLSGPESAGLTHAELEARLQVASRELFCQLVQDHLDLRAEREPRLAEVVDADQVPRDTVEARRARTLATVFGDVRVERLAYRARAHADLHPADAMLNLPQSSTPMGCAGSPRSKQPAARSPRRPGRWPRPPGSGWATGRLSNSPSAPRSTSTRSTPPGHRRCARPARCWCCHVTARAW